MQELPENSFSPDELGRLGLPPISYPLPAELQLDRLADEDKPPLEQLLYWLQLCSAKPGADWLSLEYAMQQLMQQLVLQTRPSVANNPNWWFELAPVAFDANLVTLERDGYMLAALCPNEDARLVITVYRPLDAGSLQLLTRLAAHPHPRLGVSMRENNWELAMDVAADSENFLVSEQGGSYLAHWPMGLGGAGSGELQEQGDQAELSPALTELQFQVYQRFVDAAALNKTGNS